MGSEMCIRDSVFPLDYRSQVLKIGLPSPTLALLSAISDQDLELFDLSTLYDPNEIIHLTDTWREIGMPKSLIAIGGDSSGNHFCFDQEELKDGGISRAAIYFWDHDFGDTDRLFPTFSDWIASYLESWSDGIEATDF